MRDACRYLLCLGRIGASSTALAHMPIPLDAKRISTSCSRVLWGSFVRELELSEAHALILEHPLTLSITTLSIRCIREYSIDFY
jgi:hypothetical protein